MRPPADFARARQDERERRDERGRPPSPIARSDLRHALLAEVIPRIAMPSEPTPGLTITPEEVVRFADLAVGDGLPALLRGVELLQANGASADAIALDLLTPAARHLGALWLEDRLSFLQVTLGTTRLHGVLRRLAPAFRGTRRDPARTILLAAVSGEQHTFGLAMMAMFFERAGWTVTLATDTSLDDHLLAVAAGRFRVVGLGAGGIRSERRLPDCVGAIRAAGGPDGPGILVGGPAILADPSMVSRCGADGTAVDGPGAVRAAADLLRHPDGLAIGARANI